MVLQARCKDCWKAESREHIATRLRLQRSRFCRRHPRLRGRGCGVPIQLYGAACEFVLRVAFHHRRQHHAVPDGADRESGRGSDAPQLDAHASRIDLGIRDVDRRFGRYRVRLRLTAPAPDYQPRLLRLPREQLGRARTSPRTGLGHPLQGRGAVAGFLRGPQRRRRALGTVAAASAPLVATDTEPSRGDDLHRRHPAQAVGRPRTARLPDDAAAHRHDSGR